MYNVHAAGGSSWKPPGRRRSLFVCFHPKRYASATLFIIHPPPPPPPLLRDKRSAEGSTSLYACPCVFVPVCARPRVRTSLSRSSPRPVPDDGIRRWFGRGGGRFDVEIKQRLSCRASVTLGLVLTSRPDERPIPVTRSTC